MGLADWIRDRLGIARTHESSRLSSTVDEDEDSNLDPFNPFPEPIDVPLADIIDLHTIPAREIKRVVEEYLYQAQEAKFPVVRIIHGKGVGVQREIVRSVLAQTPYVLDWTDAPPEAGGLGATIVRFK